MMTVRLGMLTPSSNTVLEPITTAMLAGVSGVTAHFSRFKVTEIALSQYALGQFDHGEVLRAAELLAHAKVDVIAWNGTSASWLGFDYDERLCEHIIETTDIQPAPPCSPFVRSSASRPESAQSWRELLIDVKWRGLETAPDLAREPIILSAAAAIRASPF
jgi:maleate cis-trans isomerase